MALHPAAPPTASEQLRLTYYGVRGCCDKVRLLMAVAGFDFAEVSATGRDYVKVKHALPFGQLPLLEDGDVSIVHANAIMRHLARKAGLYGSCEREMAACDMWMEQIEEIQQALWNADFMKVEESSEYKQAQLKERFQREYLLEALRNVCRAMARNDTMYLVGNKLTFVDIMLFSLLEAIEVELPLALSDCPLLVYFRDSLKKHPRIDAFCKSGRRH